MKTNMVLMVFGMTAIFMCGYSEEARSQVTEEWVVAYDGATANDTDFPYDMAIDDSGNVYVTGVSQYNCITVKYNSAGINQWVVTYDSAGQYDSGQGMVLDNSRNIYVAGFSGSNFLVLKYKNNGIEEWSKYGPSGIATAIVVDDSANVYVTGYSSGTNLTDYTTLKYDSSGTQKWVMRYNGQDSLDDYANAIALDNAGNILVTGFSQVSGDYGDYATVKYDANGTEQWVAVYDGQTNFDEAFFVTSDKFGNVYVTGNSDKGGCGFPEPIGIATVKYNSSGIEQWAARYSGLLACNEEWVYDMKVDENGNVYVAGSSEDSTGSGNDYILIKYDSTGIEKWVARYDSGIDAASALALDAYGNIYVTGGSNSKITTIKYDSQGNQVWLITYTASLSAVGYFITVDKSGNVYVCGSNFKGSSDYDIVIIKYSQPGWGIEDLSNENKTQVIISPNPFTSSATLRVTGDKGQGTREFTMYDLLGREVTRSVILSGAKNLTIHRNNLPAGMYFYKVTGDKGRGTREIIATGKIIIQ